MTRARDVASNGGLVLLNTSSYSTSTVTIDNVFSSAYNNYRVIITGICATNTNTAMTFRTSGGDLGVAGYCYQLIEGNGTGFRGARTTNGTSGAVTDSGAMHSHSIFDILNPSVSGVTQWFANGMYNATSSTAYIQSVGGFVNDNSIVTGFKLGFAGTWTGNVRIYGYRNA
jgi:hypothetical protein